MKKSIIYLVTAIIILVIALLTWQYVKQSSNNPKENSILVLPFSIDSTNDDEYLVDGIMNETIGNLGKVSELKVISKTTANQFKGSNKSPSEIAKSLDVNYFVEGNVKTLNDSIEMQVRLLDETGDQIWSKTYMVHKNELSEIYNKIQQDITVTIQQ